MKKRIDFIVIGAQKAGTTALYHYLTKHPQIAMASQKELHYFCQNDGSVGSQTYDKYHEYFAMDNLKVEGEITPDYLGHIFCPKRIYEYNPDIKLILILRNPIDRAYSQWNMNKNEFNEKRSFANAVLLDAIKSFKSKISINIMTTFFRKGLYGLLLENYFRFFRKEQLLIIKYEDYISQQEEQLKLIFDFLGVDSNAYSYEFKEVFKSTYEKKMSYFLRVILRILYHGDISKVERMTAWDCSDWK